MSRNESDLPDWVEKVKADIRNLRADVKGLNENIKSLANQQPAEPPAPLSPSCLVVEDDELIAQVLVHLLEREGYRVQRFADGRAALQAIEQAVELPNLVLLDVMLPYVDGFELIRVIREQKKWTEVPIVMLTAKQQESGIVRALDAGASDYIIKPFQPNELIARLRRILRAKGEE